MKGRMLPALSSVVITARYQVVPQSTGEVGTTNLLDKWSLRVSIGVTHTIPFLVGPFNLK